jgi:hypothetical protein
LPTSSLGKNPYCDKLRELGLDIKNLGPLSMILGHLAVDQEEYLDRVLKRYNMDNCKGSATPMDVGVTSKKKLAMASIPIPCSLWFYHVLSY